MLRVEGCISNGDGYEEFSEVGVMGNPQEDKDAGEGDKQGRRRKVAYSEELEQL